MDSGNESITNSDSAHCPMCGSVLNGTAKACRSCGEPRPPVARASWKLLGLTLMDWLVLFSLIAVVFVLAWPVRGYRGKSRFQLLEQKQNQSGAESNEDTK
jgi:disulfide bond formation protein DsbB